MPNSSIPSTAESAADDRGIRFLATFDAKLQVYSPKYTFLLSYVLTNIVLFFMGAVEEHSKWPDDHLRAWTIPIARGFGYMLNLNIALEFLLASRMLLSFLRNSVFGAVLPIDQAMPELHTIVGYVSLLSAILHGIFHSIGGIARNMWQPGFGHWTWCFATGLILLSLMALMVTTAMQPMRKANFERFINVHLIGAAIFIPLICLHGFYNGKLYTYKWVLGPAVIYFFDRVLRKRTENAVSLRIQVNPDYEDLACNGDIVRLAFSKPFKFRAGQYAEICVPAISETEWHPFTIASAPSEVEIVFFIKKVGDWTFALHQLCKYGIDIKRNCPVTAFDVKVRGPYGAPAQHVGQYDKILLVSGGVGATPFCSITKAINEEISRQYVEKKKIAQAQSNSSLSTVMSSLDSIDLSHSSSDIGDELPNISKAGITFEYSIHRPRRAIPQEHAEIFKHPTIGRNRNNLKELSALPTQTWIEFLHTLSGTTAYNTLVVWLLLIRFAINLLAVAFCQVNFEGEGNMIFKGLGMTLTDLILSIFSLLLILFAIIVELLAEKRAFIEDFALLIPLSSIPVFFHNMAFLDVEIDTGKFSRNLFYIAWPLILALSLFRYFRILGRRAFLSESVRRSHQTTRSVDFIWTTQTSGDDIWLIDELNRTLGHSKFVRLHRFITREAPPDIESRYSGEHGENRRQNMFSGNGRLCRDHFGRPNWQQIFENFTANSKNGTTTGIFFCGPPGMAAAVKQAAMHSMLDSRYRGLSNYAKVKQGPGLNFLLFAQGTPDIVPDALSRSFNVRYVFREEKF